MYFQFGYEHVFCILLVVAQCSFSAQQTRPLSGPAYCACFRTCFGTYCPFLWATWLAILGNLRLFSLDVPLVHTICYSCNDCCCKTVNACEVGFAERLMRGGSVSHQSKRVCHRWPQGNGGPFDQASEGRMLMVVTVSTATSAFCCYTKAQK